MNMTLNTEGYSDFMQEVANLSVVCDEKMQKKALKEIGDYVKSIVKQFAPKASDKNQTHICNDVIAKLGKTKSTKENYVSIKGGKDTGWRWVFVNNGFTDAAGVFHEGNHFVDKAEKACEQGVEAIVEKYIKEALKDG